MDKFLDANYWQGLLNHAGLALIKILAVIIIFFIAKAIGKKIIERTFNRYKAKKEVTAGRVYTLEKLTMSIFSYSLFFIFLVIIFSLLGLPIASLLAGAGIVGLAVGFGAQGLVSDIVTGFFILLEKQMDVGEVVTISGIAGVVEEVGLRTTQLRGFDGVLHFIPNRDITSVSNHSRGNMRALVDIGIGYTENIDEAIKVIQEVCKRFAEENDFIMEGPDVLGVQAINASDVTIRVIAQTKNGEQFGVERDLKKAIKEALDTNDIEIPFPHQVFIQKNA